MKTPVKCPLTDDELDALTQLLRDGLNIKSASNYLGKPLPTVEKWLRKYPRLRMAVDEAIAHHEHQMLSHATRHATRDGKVALAILERRFAHWNKPDKSEVTASVKTTTVSPALLAALAAGKEEVRPPSGGVLVNQPTSQNRG